MTRLAGFLACVCAAFALFYVSARTPPPLGATAPDALFSANRALTDIAAIAETPHPVGSAAHDRVRAYLVARLAHMGLAPRLQSGVSLNSRRIGEASYVSGASVTNVIGVLPGKDRTLPALALMAHYDTVPGSPGAADDSTGVGVALETLRALTLHGTPDRDVDLILTDGEELGLLGAQSFFDNDPTAAHVGFVINLEARGGGGRAAMFQTGLGDGADIDLFSRTSRMPASTSLLPFIYKFLPNDTDFTVSLAHGAPGYNVAFIGRQFDYHSPTSTVAALDKGSVQHMGDEILGPATALAFSPSLPPRAPDVVFADVFGLGLIHYPPVWGWLALGLAGALIVTAAVRAGPKARITFGSVAVGVAAGLIILVLAGGLLFLARQATGAGGGWFAYRPLLARFPVYEVALGLCALAAILAVAAVAGARGRSPGGWIGLLGLGLVAACALQVVAPLAAFVLAWPLLAACLCAAMTAAGTSDGPLSWGGYALLAIATLAWVGGFFHLMLEGLDLAPACALFAWLAGMILWPLATPSAEGRGGASAPGLAAALVFVVAGLGLAVWLAVTSPWSPRHPRAVAPQIVETPDAVWRATLPPLDPWTQAFLGTGPLADLTNIAGEPDLIATPQPGVTRSSPNITLSRSPDGDEILTANFDSASYSLALDVRADVPLAVADLQGVSAKASFQPGTWTHIRWRAQPGETVRLTLRGERPGTVTLRYSRFQALWPAKAAPIPPLDPNHMAWGDRPPITVISGQLTGAL